MTIGSWSPGITDSDSQVVRLFGAIEKERAQCSRAGLCSAASTGKSLSTISTYKGSHVHIIKVAIVGAGAQTRENLLPALLQVPNVRIVAVCDQMYSRAEEVRQFVEGAQLFDDVESMLGEIDLDAVVLACPPQAHRDISILAMKRGIHVFVEKPPCFTLAELRQMVELAEQHKVITAVGLNFRFARPMQQVRSILAGESFGKLVHLQINHYASKPRTPLWGMSSTLRSFLLAQAIHSIDLVSAFGGEIARTGSSVQFDGDALLARINVDFKSGVSAAVLTGTMFPYFEFEMKLISDRSKMIAIDNLWNITLHENGHTSPTTGPDKRWRSAWQPGPLDSGYERSGYLGELLKFFEAIRTKAEFEGSFKSMLPTYEVIDSVCQHEEKMLAAA